MKKIHISRQQSLSTIVLICWVICFFLGWIILLTHENLFTSRWLVDRLLFALPTQFFLSLLWVTKQRKVYMWYFFTCVSAVLIWVAILSWYFSRRTCLLGMLRWATWWYVYWRQRQRLVTRRRRSAWWYIVSQVALRWSCISLLTTISIISTIWSTGINCSQIENSLRLSWMQQKFDISSLGSFLGADALIISHETLTWTTSLQTWEATGLLWLLTIAKSQIYDLIIEQKDLLNHSLCWLINNQLVAIQHRPWRQIAWIALLYILIRPLVSILTWLCMPFRILIRKILVRTKLIRKQKKWVMITWLVLE